MESKGNDSKARYDGFSIMNMSPEDRDPDKIASYFLDLNLEQIIDKLVLKWGKGVRNHYMYFPKDPAEEAYRRAIYLDVKKEEVYRILMKFTQDLAEVERLRSEKEKVQAPIQKFVWQIRETGAYCEAYDELIKGLEEAHPTSEGMLEFMRILKDIMENGGYREILEKTRSLIRKMRELRFVLTYDKDRISVELVKSGKKETEPAALEYDEMLKKSGREAKQFQNPFRNEAQLTELERACLEILIDKDKDFFKELKDVAESVEQYEKPVLKRFENELLFYLSFASLARDMEKEGFWFVTPGTSEDERMEAKGLYDLALALTSLYTGKKVVPNDFNYNKGERFFVLTGPNQGGKTTFARSLGQLVYFSKMGLDVPAREACLPFFPDIQTHFSVEESVETGRGKLKEELIRLAPMMAENRKGTFVIINELFTTAASYDAQIMGKKVLKHFIELGCMGIYVTHLKELAELGQGVVSLRATLDDRRIQTFRILRGEAEDTPCAENQVNKYKLTYEQLKERLK
ncbi:MAG: hypothetical protein K6E85_17100 [Lachnospiraceae bacterium]|nr:hypothetical protein [Lachnospiraceae bacterium]